jgi:predicted nucleic acid-binding protein
MNGNKFLLDTNTVLYLLNGDKTLAALLNQKDLYLSFISEIELLGYNKLSQKEKNLLQSFIKECIVIDVNSDIKISTIDIRNRYNIKLGDSIIAATAIYADLPFVTSDKGFNKIKELDLILYEK